MEVKINLEMEGVDELKKDIEILQLVIRNKEEGLPYHKGLDKYTSTVLDSGSDEKKTESKTSESYQIEKRVEDSNAAKKEKEMDELVGKVNLSKFLSNMG